MATEFDFYSDEFQLDPSHKFQEMQEQCPFHHSEKFDWYSVFRHKDITSIVRDNETYSARFGPGPDRATAESAPVLVSADPPLHSKQKKAITAAFNPQTIAAMEPGIRAFVSQRMDAMVEMPECDLMEEIADQLPMWVICKMLDIPFDQDYEKLLMWVDAIAGAVFSDHDEEMHQQRLDMMTNVYYYFGPHIQVKIDLDKAGKDPGDDLLSLIVKARIDGEPVPFNHILSFALFLLVAGSGTTTTLIGSFFNRMMAHPDQWEKLLADPALLDNAIEEVLRIDSPVHGLFRTNNVPVKLGDLDVPVDSKICLMWGSANLDPEVFENPLEFDITRDAKVLRKHLSFGTGIHACIGGPLARLECKVVVEEFLKRFDGMERMEPMVPYPYPTLHGPYKLPVRLTAKKHAA
jgi:cytochrome P450